MSSSPSDIGIEAILDAVHRQVIERHHQERNRLLNSISKVKPQRNKASATSFRLCLIGGIGIAVASIMFLSLWVVSNDSSAAAMERLASALEEITSYTFRMEDVYTSRQGAGRQVRHVITGRWRTEPIGLHARHIMSRKLNTNTATPANAETIVDLEETHTAESGGIVVDHLTKQYWRIHEPFDASAVPGGSPQVVIHKVRQRRGQILKELGVKKVNGVTVRGFELLLDAAEPTMELGLANPEIPLGQAQGWDWRNIPVEVWVDPKSNLPVEFRCERSGDDFTNVYRFTDLAWNVEFPEDAFVTDPPAGYTEKSDFPLEKQQP